MKYIKSIFIAALISLPIFLMGAGIGAVAGLLARWLSMAMGLYETAEQYDAAFWFFLVLGSLMGLVKSVCFGVLFVRHGPKKPPN